MSMIIGRKQVILAALVLALGTAIFLNWRFSGNEGINFANVFNASSSLGDASLVDNQKVGASSSTDSYFASARLNRQQTRAQAAEVLKTLTTNTTATTADKQSAQTAIEALAKNITNETTMESLVKAKGFGDCVAFINEGTVNVVVKPKTGNTLTPTDIAQIQDIVIQQTKIATANIHIIQSK